MYHLFGGKYQYPAGTPMSFYLGSYDSIEEAKTAAVTKDLEWAEIVVQTEGDLTSPAKLDCVVSGESKWEYSPEDFTVGASFAGSHIAWATRRYAGMEWEECTS